MTIDVSNIELGDEYEGIEAFVVGGYTRDTYMGLNPNDVDIVVTGVTSEDMLERGFNHIMSNDTRKPVFQDSHGREAAIARSEKSTGDKPNSFDMDIISPDISSEKAIKIDLNRRDLTINSIAVNIRTGKIHDPYNGREDIENKSIRHVSDAFKEDPLRVIRAARYAARFNFEIVPETLEIMRNTIDKLPAIPTPRFGLELVKVFKQSDNPRLFFDTLININALSKSYPEVAALDYVPAGPYEYHKEGSAYEHTMRVIQHMHNQIGNDVNGLLAALFHDVGKAATLPQNHPHHYGHEKKGADMANDIYIRYEFNRERRGVLSTSARSHMHLNKLDELNATTVLKYAKMIKNSPLSVENAVALGKADSNGKIPQSSFYKQKPYMYLNTAISVLNDIGGKEALESRGYTVKDVGSKIPGERVNNLIRQDRAEEFRKRIDNKIN